jgi:hypothetical protein
MPVCSYAFVPQLGCAGAIFGYLILKDEMPLGCSVQTCADKRRPDADEVPTLRSAAADLILRIKKARRSGGLDSTNRHGGHVFAINQMTNFGSR